MGELRKYKSCCLDAKLCLTLFDPTDYSLPGSSVHGIFRQEYWSALSLPFPGDLPNPGIKPTSPALQAASCIAGEFFIMKSP